MKTRKGQEFILDSNNKVVGEIRGKDFKLNWRDEIEYRLVNLEKQDFAGLYEKVDMGFRRVGNDIHELYKMSLYEMPLSEFLKRRIWRWLTSWQH